jgi:4-hydroxy-2-oxoheptanedioate aldolase
MTNANNPMTANPVKTRILARQPVLGVLANSPDPTIAEVCGRAGLDFYMIDTEHGPITATHVADIVRACIVAGITPLARVSLHEPGLIRQCLDAGVLGIMAPGINTVAEAETLVRTVKYAPMGHRGLGNVRVAEFLQGAVGQAEYVQWANENTLVLPQIETTEAIRNLSDLCAVPGLDGFIVGPRDLSMSMGQYDGPGSNEVKRAIAGVVETVTSAGLLIGTMAATGDQAKALIDRGVLLCMNTLPGLLKSAVSEFVRK